LHYAWKIFHENILPLFSPNDQKYFHKLFCFSLTNLKAQFIPQGVQNSQDFPVKLAINRNQLNDSHFLLDLSETYTFAYTDNNPPIDVKERDSLNFQADQDKNWRNQLFCGDNRDILNILKSQYLNQIQLIYIDPPFYTGTNEYMDVSLRGSGGYFQEHPTQILKTMAYKNVIVNSDHINTFSTWLYERINLMHKLLQQKGFLALRFDYHYGHYAKTILDDIFGESNYINEYLIRRMHKNVSKKSLHLQQRLIVQNDSLFLYRKTPAAQFQEIVNKKKRTNQNPSEIESNTNNNWMDIVGYEKSKKTLYPTENSRHLLSRIIQLCSSPNDLIADFFAGSGTTLTVAQSLNRNWIGADIGEKSIHEIRKRLVNQLSVNHPPFQLFYLNPLIESQSKKSSIQPHQKTIQLKLHQTSKTKHYSTFGFFNHSKKPFLEFIVKKFNQSKTLIIEFVRYNYLDHSNILDNDLSLDNSLSLIDFWAIDWNFKKSAHFFAQDIYFQKIGQGRKIINQTEKRCQHIYPISGSYQILIKTKDIFGYEINHFFTFSFLQ
jgi:DNA modification methylase